MDKFILEPFNTVFFVTLAITFAFALVYVLIFRKKSYNTRRLAVIGLYTFALIFFFVYKYWIANDAAYSVICEEAGIGGFSWWKELPLQVCNINILIGIIGVLLESDGLIGFTFYTSSLGALMALIMPPVGFDSYSIFLPRMIGYFGTHLLVLIEMPIIAGLKLYEPRYKKIPKVLLTAFMIAVVVFCITFTFRATGLEPFANYWYAFDPEGNPILEIFRRFIPIDGLYLLPALLILVPYMCILTFFFRIGKGESKKPRNNGFYA